MSERKFSTPMFYTAMIVSFVHLAHAAMGPLTGLLRIENRDGVFTHRVRALYDALSAVLNAVYELPNTEQADLDFHNSSFPKLREIARELNEISEALIQAETTSEDVRDAASHVKRFLLDSQLLDDSTTGYRRTARASFACFRECELRVTLDPQGILGMVTRILYLYPCWVGILEPAQSFMDWKEELLARLEVEDLTVQLENPVTGETWLGRLSDLVSPEPEYPWHELLWSDDRKP